MNRRQALIHLGVGAAGLMVHPRSLAATPDILPDRLADLAELVDDLHDLALTPAELMNRLLFQGVTPSHLVS